MTLTPRQPDTQPNYGNYAPITPIPNRDHLDLATMFHAENGVYVLRVKGDGFTDWHLADGDSVVIELRKAPRNGEVIVGQLDGEVFIARFYQDTVGDILDTAKIRLNIQLPSEAKQGPTFTLFCSAWDQILIGRIEKEGQIVAGGLVGFTVVHGIYRTTSRKLG